MTVDNRKEIDSMSVDELRNLVSMQREQLNNLQIEVSRLRAALFGKKSEKRSRADEEQQLLFNEIEANAKPEEERKEKTSFFVRGHARKKPGR